MSWLGEQFSSFTEKISDFTKEMLPDNGISSSNDLSSEETCGLSPNHLLNLCKEKDAEISSLMNEKASLEKSIEELDTQHQEAISELLYLKNEAVNENTALKKELTLQKENASIKSLFRKFEHNYCLRELKSDENQPLSEIMNSIPIKNFNLVNIIGELWKNYSDISINNILEWLTEQKSLLEAQTLSAGDNSSRNVINRLNIYIDFLYLMSNHPKLFSHIIDEIASVIHFFLSNHANENSHFSVPEIINEKSSDDFLTDTEIERSDFSSQTFTVEFETVRNLFSANPNPFVCKAAEINSETASHFVQTDENSIVDCNLLISEMKRYILHLEEQKAELEDALERREDHITFLLRRLEQLERQVNSFSDPELTASVFVQTENFQNEISSSNSHIILESSSVQTDNFDCNCNDSSLNELQAYVDILMQEKMELQSKIQELHILIDKPKSSSVIQTDEYTCTCNIHELEAGICILEQDKADLEEELSHLKSLLRKPVSSVLIQTEENFDLLQPEISHLQEIFNSHEKEYNDTIKKLNVNVNSLKEDLIQKEFIICDKEDKIQFLEHKCNEYIQSIECLTNELSKVDDLNKLKEELQHSENSAREKDDIIHSLLCELNECKSTMDNLTAKAQQASDLVNLKDELKRKNLALQDKESVIESLECEVAKYISIVSNLQESQISDKLKDEIKLNEHIIQEKEKRINSLEKELEILKASTDNIKIQQTDEIESLREVLKSRDSEIQENISIIQSLRNNIEQYKAELYNFQETAVLMSTGIQTDDEHFSRECHESEILELKKIIFEKEKAHNIIQNQSVSTINELQMHLNSYKVLIAEKESVIKSLKSELDSCKNEIKDLANEMSKLKESSLNTLDENQFLSNQHESEIEKLKLYVIDKERELAAVESNLNSSISNLREILQSKDLIIIDKEETIQTLKLELDEAKRNLKKYLNDIKTLKAKQDYAKDIDTTEENITMIMNNCNKCKSILNGESTDNDLKNEVQVLQDKLKALEMDKNQLLCVLNEKTQECSSLKAEVHKLTNIVASEKQALYKLQQDNCLLKESRDNCDPELTKEAVQKLSGIIRDKDLEIESLKQKNVTLTTLIQDSTSVPDHLQSLIEEKENLSKQIHVFKSDRDKIMARYNSIDKDCRNYASEVKKLQSALSEQKKKFDVLEQKHFSVAQQYEEKQKSLINTQNEMIALKQRVTDLEQQQVDIKEKYGELLNKFNSDTMVQLTKDELDEKNTQIDQLMSASLEKDHLIQEKDCLIHDLSQQIKTLRLEHEQQQMNLSSFQVKVDELTTKLKEHEASVVKLQNEKEALEMRFQDKHSELSLLKEMNERLNMNLKEKEFTIQSMTEKISSLSHYISSDHNSPDTLDINQILADSESMFSKAQLLYKERDETLLALSQSKQENQSLRNEIQRMKSNEIHLKKELERLRMHLLEIEENYTTEVLKAEEREKELRDELSEVKRKAEISNTAIVDTNQRASIQIASLQEQLSIIANQRDQALAQVSTLEDKVQQHSASVSKLQLVLEQMQRGNERKIKEAEKRLVAELEKQKELYKELEEKLQNKEMQLEESTQALEAASRLSEQLDAKEEIIANLKSELSKTENKIKSTAREIDTIKSNTEGKVDRLVMKSLVLGYFSTPPGQKSEVVRLLARVLDFNQEEMEKAGIVVGRQIQKNEQRGLFSSIFGRLPSFAADKTPTQPEKSFTTLFVQFLENESQPIVPMPFPVEKMTQEVSYKQYPNKKSPTPEKKNLSKSNPLLLDIDSAFPTFTPIPAVEYSQSPAPSILREVLE